MTEIEVYGAGGLDAPGSRGVALTEHAVLTASGLRLTGDATVAELFAVSEQLGTVTDAACWAVGDALNLMKAGVRSGTFTPEELEGFLHSGRYDSKTKKVYASVAAFYSDMDYRDRYMKPVEGRPLAFAHFSEVKKLGMEQATYWLDRALTENLSLNQMLETINAGLPGTDDAPPISDAPAQCQPGVLYALGEHRLICGDSTQHETLLALFSEDYSQKAAALWTDPPYGVDYVGKTEEALTIQNDSSMDDDALLRMLVDALRAAQPFLVESAPFYIAGPTGDKGFVFMAAIRAAGWRFKQLCIWLKNTMVLGRQDHQLQHEGLYYGNAPGPNAGRMTKDSYRWYGGDNVTSIFRADKPAASRDHPTMKPVQLIKDGLACITQPGDIILDLFSGSGSTMIACEQMGRRAFMVEFDPKYADVIVRRYNEYLEEQRKAATDQQVIDAQAVRVDYGPSALEE